MFGLLVGGCSNAALEQNDEWVIDKEAEWREAIQTTRDVMLTRDGAIEPIKETGHFESVLHTFDTKRKARSLELKQTAAWDNWEKIPNIGPDRTRNAPVFLPVADGDYWFFAEKRGESRGYRAWHSTDLESWTAHGQVTESHWVTTAEYADGKIYLYHDEPNDEDPHLVICEDIPAGKCEALGKVLQDPSHGSDAGILRDEDGSFHLIYEDWDPLNARQHSWDSPLAGHAESADGINGFEPHEHPAPIDVRTTPTGRYDTCVHGTTKNVYEYEIHEGEQHAYGDFTQIKVGGQYYLFCDFDPHDRSMRIGYWTSDSITTRYEWGGDLGEDIHPDPTIGFAEGRFNLIVQRSPYDYVSPGPWVENVQARAGVDTNGDETIDEWTGWQTVSEQYRLKEGFARVVETDPARLDLSSLPEGYGFKFEFRVEDATENASRPIIDRVSMTFE